ncbi:hypothetical protein [Halorussus ruber]|uniref:hypothetical protein n=1 Tax=Halorussus ruber TaxID=1126238 RepID=UPI00109328A7|nr:hypothetical protein [Halorussus ruber]
MGDEQSDGGESVYDVASLRVTRDEARAVLDQQTEAIGEIHDKGIQVLRLNVLLLGLVLTLASILASSTTTPDIERMANGFLAAGVVTSITSMVAAVRTYSNTSFRVGAGAADVRKVLRQTPAEDEWLAALLYNYTTWMKQNTLANRRNALMLFVSHVFLFLSMGYYVGGVVYGLYFGQTSWLLSSLSAVLFGVVVGGLLVASSHLVGRNRFGRLRGRT